MLTIDLTDKQVQTVARAEVASKGRMSETEAREKLDDVIGHLEQADCIFQKEMKLHLDRAIAIMLDIDEGLGWGNLGYRSMRHMIQAELEPRFSLSGSQIYRRFGAAKVRKGVSQIWSDVDTVPDTQLNELRKLPCEQWKDALEEITSLAPNGKITTKHVKKIVESRRPSKKRAVNCVDNDNEQRALRSNELVESFNENALSENYHRPGTIMDQSNESNQASSFADSTIEVNNLITIQCSDSATSSQRKYKGCWGIIDRVLESTAIVAVGGELVEYPLSDLHLVENPTQVLTQVCDRVTRLWQTPNLPASVQHLVATFYQRRLDFSQSDLDVLAAIESCVTPSSPTNLVSEKEYSKTNNQNKIKAAGVDNQIARIIFANE
jgi:polyhydroxyalkanoate synthesis regulator phasin